MKFTVKSLLIIVLGLGGVFGLFCWFRIGMPDVFPRLRDMKVAIVPLIFAIGTILFLGWWVVKRNSLGSTRICNQCQNEISNVDLSSHCPVCGTDLPAPKMFSLPRRQRNGMGTAIWGIGLLLSSILVAGSLAVFWPTRDPLEALSNQRLIQDRLPFQIDDPAVWHELVSRLNKNALSQGEVDQTVEVLIGFMRTTQPRGWSQRLTVQKTFIEAAIHQEVLSERVLLKLCDAFFGTQPTITPLPSFSTTGFPIHLQYGNRNYRESGLNVNLVWSVKQILLDGVPANCEQPGKSNENWNGFCADRLTPGAHELYIELECAYIDERALFRLNMSSLPVKDWPTARKRWTSTISVPFEVEALDLKQAAPR